MAETRLYKLPKVPGTYIAEKISELNVDGLITGAEIISDKRVIVLTGYEYRSYSICLSFV